MSQIDNGGNEVLRSIVERIERLQEEKDGLAADIGEIKKEAKSQGFHVPALNELLRKRRMDRDKRALLEANLEIYEEALGAFKDTPLGEAGRQRVAAE